LGDQVGRLDNDAAAVRRIGVPPGVARLLEAVDNGGHAAGGEAQGMGQLQAIGSLLTVLFALALVHLAGATHRFAGWVTLLAGTTILLVSLVEVTFYLAAAQAAVTGNVATGTLSNALIKAVQHVFLVAPALLLPLGAVLLSARVLPRVFAYLALALGAVLQALGLVGLFGVLQPVIDVLLIVQGVWFLAAAITLAVRPMSTPAPASTVRPAA